jgi:hypothetical protein
MATIKDYDNTQTVRTPESIKLEQRLRKRFPGLTPHKARRAMQLLGRSQVAEDLNLLIPYLEQMGNR